MGGRGGGRASNGRGSSSRGSESLDAPFYLEFDVNAAEAEHGLAEVSHAVEEVGHSAEEAAEHTAHMAHVLHGLHESVEIVEHVGHALHSVGHQGIGVVEQMGHSVFHVASEFDTLRAQLSYAFREGTEEAFQRLQTFEQNSSYPMSELIEGVSTLRSAFHGIDPTRLERSFRTSTGQMVSGLEALSDAAAGAQVGLGNTIQIVERALEGNFESLQYQMRLSQTEVSRMQAEMARATDEQGKYDAIVRGLALHWGGAQAAVGNTFAMTINKISAMWEQLRGMFGAAGLQLMTPALQELHHWMREFAEDHEAIDGVKNAFTFLGGAVAWVVRAFTRLLHGLQHLAKEYPNFLKYLMAAVTIGGALAVALGTVLSTMGSLATAILAVKSAFGILLPLFSAGLTTLLAIGAALAVVVAVGYALKRAYDENLGGFSTKLRQVWVLVRALSQAIRNFGETSTFTTQEIATELQALGMDKIFINIVLWIARARAAWRGFSEAMSAMVDRVMPPLRKAFGEVSQALTGVYNDLRRAFGESSGFFEATQTKIVQATASGRAFGEAIATYVVPVILAIAKFIKIGVMLFNTAFLPAIKEAISLFRDAYGWLSDHFGEMKALIKIVVGVLAIGLIPQVLFLLGLFRAVPTVLRVVWFLLRTIYSATIQPLVDAFSFVYNTAMDIGAAIQTWARDGGLEEMMRTVAGYFREAWGYVREIIRAGADHNLPGFNAANNRILESELRTTQRENDRRYAGTLVAEGVSAEEAARRAANSNVVGTANPAEIAARQLEVLNALREDMRRERRAPAIAVMDPVEANRAVTAAEAQRRERLGQTNGQRH